MTGQPVSASRNDICAGFGNHLGSVHRLVIGYVDGHLPNPHVAKLKRQVQRESTPTGILLPMTTE